MKKEVLEWIEIISFYSIAFYLFFAMTNISIDSILR